MFLPFMAISHVLAEAPDTIWTRTYGGESNDEAFKVIETSDGFFVLAGYTESFGAGESDVYLLKLDSNGDDIWIKTYGGEGNDAAYSVMETSDGYYVVAGYTKSAGGGNVYLLMLNPDGDTLWTKNFGSSDNEEARQVIQASNGDFVIIGRVFPCSMGPEHVLCQDQCKWRYTVDEVIRRKRL